MINHEPATSLNFAFNPNDEHIWCIQNRFSDLNNDYNILFKFTNSIWIFQNFYLNNYTLQI